MASALSLPIRMEPSTLNLDKLAPVAVYTYTRHDHLVRTLEALKRNHLAPHTVLYVVSDGPNSEAHRQQVQRVRDFVDDLSGFREIVRVYRKENLGLRVSPPSAEKAILSDHGSIINMEDDNITSANYLDFINGGLQHFEHDPAVFSVCGYAPPTAVPADEEGDFWYYPWNMSWGYGLWKAKYDAIHPLVNQYPARRRDGSLARQNRAGGLYISDSLKRDFEQKKYFPDAILCTEMFVRGARAIVPVRSKVQNTGQDGSGQSSGLLTDKYDVRLDDGLRRQFDFGAEARHAGAYRQAAEQLYNGGKLTRLARRLGVFHELSDLRSRMLALKK